MRGKRFVCYHPDRVYQESFMRPLDAGGAYQVNIWFCNDCMHYFMEADSTSMRKVDKPFFRDAADYERKSTEKIKRERGVK